MATFKKKPGTIDAVQMPSRDGDFTNAPEWLKKALYTNEIVWVDKDEFLATRMSHRGRTGDYVYQEFGMVHVYKRATFESMYEPA